jgi:phosphoglycolate phosphatase
MVALLWDLDGTLVDSAADIAAAVDDVLVARGLPPVGEARVRTFIGDGARQLIDRSFAAVGALATATDVEAFLDRYGRALVVHTHVHPPALRDLLARVRSPQAIVSNKPERHTRVILGALDLERYVARGPDGAPVVLGGDSLPTRKPDPAMLFEALRRLGAERGVLVGDGPADVAAAVAADMPMIGVDWGIARPEGAPVRVADVQGLEAALRAIGVPVEPAGT